MIRMEDAGAVKRWMFRYFMGVARRVGAEILDGRPGVAFGDRLLYRLGNVLVYAPLRNVLGMSRIRVAYTAGAAIGPDLFRFYRSIGVNLKQLYGSTETCAYVCLQPDGEIKFDSVGKPAPGVEVRIAGRRRGAGPRARCCSRNTTGGPTPPPKRSTRDGLFPYRGRRLLRRGRAPQDHRPREGRRQARRAARVFAPNYIENKLKFFSYIKEAVAFGHGRDEVCAFINIDIDGGGQLGGAARHRRTRATPTSRRKPRGLRADPGAASSRRTPSWRAIASLAHSQVRRFLILHKELDPDDDELTRTRKVRRGFIAGEVRGADRRALRGQGRSSTSRRR